MVVLSASITTKSGKPLLSRQFVELTRIRLEGLLTAFPKLMNTTTSSSSTSASSGSGRVRQHTFVETDAVRYVYQPIENLYLLLITNKASNIIEDLETLRLLSKVIPDVAGGVTEDKIMDNCFEIIFALDEVLTSGGYKESINLSTIKSNIEMNSHEEKLYNMIKQSKEDNARDEGKRQAKVIKERQVQVMRNNFTGNGSGNGGGGGGVQTGFGGGGNTGDGNDGDSFMNQLRNDPYGQNSQAMEAKVNENSYDFHRSRIAEPVGPRVIAKGMKLGGVGGGNSNVKKEGLMAQMAQEDGFKSIGGLNNNNSSAMSNAGNAVDNTPVSSKFPVSLIVEEIITCKMTREGEIQNSELKGTLSLTAHTSEGGNGCTIIDKSRLTTGDINYIINAHPKIDKNTWESKGKLAIKGGKGIPLSRPVGILRWSSSTPQIAPITINCWPEKDGNNSMNVNLEYNLEPGYDNELSNVTIVIPGVMNTPKVINVDGQYKYDQKSQTLTWFNSLISASNTSGSLEFNVESSDCDSDAFFPINIGFGSSEVRVPLVVLGVCENNGDGKEIGFEVKKFMRAGEYVCS